MSKKTIQNCTVSRDAKERERILLEQLPQARYIARRIHERLPRHIALDDLVHALQSGSTSHLRAKARPDRRSAIR